MERDTSSTPSTLPSLQRQHRRQTRLETPQDVWTDAYLTVPPALWIRILSS